MGFSSRYFFCFGFFTSIHRGLISNAFFKDGFFRLFLDVLLFLKVGVMFLVFLLFMISRYDATDSRSRLEHQL